MKRIRFSEVKAAIIKDFADNSCSHEDTKQRIIRDFRACKCIPDIVFVLYSIDFDTSEAYEFIVDTITRD